MQVILFQPQIPQNTGNIVRTCKVTGNDLLLVKPLGFQTGDKELKRAGLDYWAGVNVSFTEDLEKLLSETTRPFYFFSSHATKLYTEVPYSKDDLLIFGSETAGLSPVFFERWPELFFTLPMIKDSRCLNLANTVSIVLYKAWEKQGFGGSS